MSKPLVNTYRVTYIAFTSPTRYDADVPASLHPAHRVGYKQRRNVTIPGPKGVTYQARCSCGAKPQATDWHPTKPKARKLWWINQHLAEVQIQRSFPGTQEVNDVQASED